MEDDYDLDHILDSMNLTGQWQPSSMPDIMDPSLNSQILSDMIFSEDDLPVAPPSNANGNDEISNALVYQLEIDDITQLISTTFGDLPRQSTIEETIENMTLNQSHTDILSSSICVQLSMSPVEQKEIDNSILRNQHSTKNAAKSRKNGRYQQSSSSSNVGPIDVLSSYGACQPCTTIQIQDDFDYSQQLLQFDTIEPKIIQILCHPRPNFRPRTENESKYTSHYLRCEANSPYEYPTIRVCKEWARLSLKNIIEVTLVAKDKLPHNYAIDNKLCKATFEDDALIFRDNGPHTLYFCLTQEDFEKGYKSFMIEYIKGKQVGDVTKDLIKNRQLEQSMLRFTRFFQADKNNYQRDDNSVEYSSLMTEAYGDVAVEHMGPRCGPMAGNEAVYALLKGRVAKDDITVIVSEETTGWRQQVPITKNGNLIYFRTPTFPYSQYNRAAVNITVYYKGEQLYTFTYLYSGSIDQELSELNLNDSSPSNDPPPPSETFDAYNFFSATGVRPVTNSSRKSSSTKRTKRLETKK